jgi:hypothetical protein
MRSPNRWAVTAVMLYEIDSRSQPPVRSAGTTQRLERNLPDFRDNPHRTLGRTATVPTVLRRPSSARSLGSHGRTFAYGACAAHIRVGPGALHGRTNESMVEDSTEFGRHCALR